MTWLYFGSGFIVLVWVTLAVWWIRNQGKMASEIKQLTVRDLLQKKELGSKNQYIKDVDQLVKKGSQAKDKVHEIFNSTHSLDELVGVLHTLRDSKTNTSGDT